MPMLSSDRRFLAAVLASVMLHLFVMLAWGALRGLWREIPSAMETAPRAQLEARLLPRPEDAPAPADDPLLKNTLATAQPEKVEPAAVHEPPPASAAAPASILPPPKTAKAAPRVVHEARLKLAAHMFYPPAAIEQGLEGEVRVLLKLAPDGSILEAGIAAGSGHDLLDRAALNAALAMRRVPVTDTEELILPVVFKLQ